MHIKPMIIKKSCVKSARGENCPFEVELYIAVRMNLHLIIFCIEILSNYILQSPTTVRYVNEEETDDWIKYRDWGGEKKK